MLETHYVSYGENTNYRIRPNPDGTDATNDGIVLEWSDDGGKTWVGYFYISPEQAMEVAKAMLMLVGKKE